MPIKSINSYIQNLLIETHSILANRMNDTHDEENQKSDVEAVFRHSQYKLKSSFFLQIRGSRSHILVSL